MAGALGKRKLMTLAKLASLVGFEYDQEFFPFVDWKTWWSVTKLIYLPFWPNAQRLSQQHDNIVLLCLKSITRIQFCLSRVQARILLSWEAQWNSSDTLNGSRPHMAPRRSVTSRHSLCPFQSTFHSLRLPSPGPSRFSFRISQPEYIAAYLHSFCQLALRAFVEISGIISL